MADALQATTGLIPASTKLPSTVVFGPNLGPSIVRRILITWPAGCGGLVGVRVTAGGGFAFPALAGQYLAYDDYTYPFDVANQVTSGQWLAVCYNVDLIDHLITIVYEYDYLRGNQQASSMNQIAL